MRTLNILIACISFSALTLFLQSCCKQYCTDDTIFAVDFQGFQPTEIDKILVLQYNPDNFTNAVDSYYVSSNNIIIKDTTRVYLDKPLANDFNFRINVEKAGLSYVLSDIQTKKENCHCENGTYDIITNYKLNGIQFQHRNGFPLEIRK